MSETNRVGDSTSRTRVHPNYSQDSIWKGKTKYVLGSVGEREVKVNKKETTTEIEATNQLASVNREN